MIDLSDFSKEVSDLSRGETIRVSHTECPAGQDTRRRLYLTRPAGSPGIVLGYCHNCQDKGLHHDRDPSDHFRGYNDERDASVLTEDKDFVPPPNLIEKCDDWPIDAHTWRVSKRISEEDCDAICIAYDPATHRMYLPMWDRIPHSMTPMGNAPELEGYQLRRLSDKGPKYLTVVRNKDRQPSTVIDPHPPHQDDHTIAVLVEDLASGMAVANALEHSIYAAHVLVNYGTKVTPEVLHRVTDFETAVVWLDNDSEHVTSQAYKIAKVWRMLSGAYVAVEEGMHDPKALDQQEIKAVIGRHWNGQH